MPEIKNRSITLRKYELAYESCIMKAMKKNPKISKSKSDKEKTKCFKKLYSDIKKSIQKSRKPRKSINKNFVI